MKEVTFEIPEEIVSKLEALSFEIEARKSVIAEMLAQNMDISTDAFAKYQKELVEFNVMFETLKGEVTEQYADKVEGGQRWTIDYKSRLMTVTVAQ